MARTRPLLKLAAPEAAPDYFIHAQAATENRSRILKHGDTFGVFDFHGDIIPGTQDAPGLYHRDTRHLSGLRLQIAGRYPLLLSSNLLLNNAALKVDLANPDIFEGDECVLPRDVLNVGRTRFLWRGRLYERLAVRNYAIEMLEIDLDIAFLADFSDIFEARGFKRTERGVVSHALLGERRVQFVYAALDGRERSTTLSFNPPPEKLDTSNARYRLSVPPGKSESLFLTVDCNDPGTEPQPNFLHDMKKARRPIRAAAERSAGIETSNQLVNEMLCRSMADLTMLMTETPHGSYPYAGVPWFSTVFGRDGLITALFTLWMDPSLARGVLCHLAAMQSDADDPEADAERGKILHEARDGELAHLGAVPFRRYYGSIDATPLFVLLAGAYYQRTGDLQTIRRLHPSISLALQWIKRASDPVHKQFLEYERKSATGLVNQGWKDSHDSVFHALGELATGPIALVEVQGYAYAAFLAAARLARALGRPEEAASREQQAEALRAATEEHFWCDDLGLYALALDRSKVPCKVRSSNAGQLLFSGLPRPDRAAQVAKALLSPSFFTGFGVRTLATTEARYNPMSYHNGSVWPHDNALIALGFAQYGLKAEVLQILEGLFDAAQFMELRRLPELFCGFRRRPGTGPTLYPVACSPQAWASAAPFALMQAALGLTFDYEGHIIRFDRPRLPANIEEVRIRNLRLGDGAVDVMLCRAGEQMAANVMRRCGEIDVVVTL